MNKLSLAIAAFLVTIILSCNSNSQREKIILHDTQIDSIRRFDEKFFGWNSNKEDKTSDYTWFTLGEDNHQIVDRLFYVSNIETIFKENGYQIKGTIGNICAMEISNAILQCGIKDSTISSKIISGTTTVETLNSGSKIDFSVFIPTTKTNFKEIGVWVHDYRM
jgi:hypothetical protein